MPVATWLQDYFAVCIMSSTIYKKEEKSDMMTLDEIRHAMRDRRLDILSDATGISRQTLHEIRSNPDANPRYETLKALSDYLEQNR